MKILPTLLTLAVAATGAAGLPSVHARTATEPKPMDKTAKPSAMVSDKEFFQKVAQAGMAEVELGKMAMSQSASEGVKKFGQEMVADHGKANTELMQLAAKKGVALPKQTDAEHQKLIADLRGKKGADFDRLYVQQAGVKGHTKVVALMQAASKSSDADVQAFATKTLPTIQHHLHMAEQLANGMASK